jgi:hypothetical protein
MRKKIIFKNKKKVFQNLLNNLKEMKTIKTIQHKEKECEDKLNEMSQFYGKEINDLRAKLNEANKQIEKYKESKSLLQDNLKKALMRGVVAMNLEAMNVLEGDPSNNSNLKLMENLIGNLNLSNNSSSSNLNINTQNSIPNSEKENSNFVKTNLLQNNPKNNVTNPISLNENYDSKKKLVIKDNNWVNASSVPTKLKSNIISIENDNENNENEFEESFRIKSTNINNQHIKQKSNQGIIITSPKSQHKSVHDELTKSKNFKFFN